MSSRNCYAEELREQTATQDSNCQDSADEKSKKYLSSDVSIMQFADEKIYPATDTITDCTQVLQQTKRLRSTILSHIINVPSKSLIMSVGKTKSVYTSLIII